MAKIRNSHPKQSGGGYERLVGNPNMAAIFTKAQSTVITNGTELEKIISSKAIAIEDLDQFIDECDRNLISENTYLCSKKVLKKSSYQLAGHEPDFIAFRVDKIKNICHVVELKDGDSFDTKKSYAEKEMLEKFVNHLAPKIPFRTCFFICCFNQTDKDKIVAGFKNAFSISEIMTGKEFCDFLNIDYQDILKQRSADTLDNFKYVIEKMTEIPEVKETVLNEQRKHIVKDEFYNPDDEDEERSF